MAEEERWASEGIAATYVGCDARQSGTFQGEEIAETSNKGDINGDGKVSYIMIQGLSLIPILMRKNLARAVTTFTASDCFSFSIIHTMISSVL